MLRAMRWIVLVVLVVLAACSKDAPPASPLVGKLRAVADRMCACTDAACVAAVEREWTALPHTTTLSADDVELLAADTQRYLKCSTAWEQRK